MATMSSDQYNGTSPYDQNGYEHSQSWGAGAQPPAGPAAGQPSANQPAQPAAPVSQPSAADAYGQQQPAADAYGQQQYASSAYPAQQQYTPQQQGGYYPPQQPVPPAGNRADANPLKALFDFSFTSYATPNLIKIVYIAAIALGVLYWLGMTIALFAAGSAPSAYGSSGTAIPGVLTLLFGWIPLLFWIAMMRLTLEFYLANVRTAADVRTILDKIDQP